MTLPELSVRRPVLAAVAALLILAMGVAAAFRLPVREYPDVDPPRVAVSVVYPGASAEVVERDVTQTIEDNLNGIDAVELIDSTSRAGFAEVTVEFALSRDLDAAAADVRDRVSAIRGELPDEAEDAVIRKSSAQSQAMMWITLTSKTRDRRALTDFALRTLVDPLSIEPGVSQVILGGARRYAMRIRLDARKMAARDVTALDVAAALRRENVEAPAGRIETPSREYTVRTDTKLLEAEAFRDLILRDVPGAGQVRLWDVAEIELGAESDRSAVFRDGAPAVGLGVVRQSGANTVAVAERVKAALDRLAPRTPEDVDLSISYDQSVFVSGSLREVVKTLLITVGLVVAVVWLSLGSVGATLAPAATIPVAAIGAVTAMLAAGFSINTLTLLALVLAIGLVVDDAIVVVENVTRKKEAGQPRLAAAVEGANEVFMAVVATTVVLAATLLPIAALGGFVGRLFTEFAITLTATVLLSSFLALTIGAAIASRAGAPAPAGPARAVGDALAWAEARYARLAGELIRAPWLVAALTLALGAAGAALVQTLPGGLAPTEDRAVFLAPVETPKGATLSETVDVARRIERILAPYRDGGEAEAAPIEEVISIVGAGETGPSQPNTGIVIVKLKPWGARETGQQALVSEVTGPIVGLPGAEAAAISPASLTPQGFGKPIQLVLSAPDYETARRWAETVRAEAEALGTMRSLEVEFDRRAPQVRVAIDRARAADLGLDVAEIGESLRLFLGGDDVTEFYREDETYEVMVRGLPADRDSPDDVAALEIRAANGALVPLAAVAETRAVGAADSYRRIDRRPSVVLSAVPAQGADLAGILASLRSIADRALPPAAETGWLGVSRDFMRSQSGVLGVFGLALAVIYLVLAALFSSFLTPLVVMLAVPLALAFGLLGLWAGGHSVNLFTQIGLLLTVGLLAKNAILVVDFADRRRVEGMERGEAALAAARARFRPVAMTSIATLFGALPLALATGPGAESRSAIGATVMAGVAGATVISLLVTPGLYRIAARYSAPPGATSRAVDRQLAAEG